MDTADRVYKFEKYLGVYVYPEHKRKGNVGWLLPNIFALGMPVRHASDVAWPR